MSLNRRQFVRMSAWSTMAAGLAYKLRSFQTIDALAATTDYKALVCVFLLGGNDANNMVIPFTTSGYNNYAKLRANLALAQSSLLPVGNGSYALHPNLPFLQSLYNKGNAAALFNVGTLVAPVTQATLKSATLPTNLFSTQISNSNGSPMC